MNTYWKNNINKMFDMLKANEITLEELQRAVNKALDEVNGGVKEISVGDTVVEVKSNEISPVVNITTPDATVIVNNDTLWAKYEEEEYKYIPPAMRAFVQANQDYMKLEKEDLIVDVYIDGRDVSLYFPVNRRKRITARFSTISTLDHVFEYIGDMDLTNKRKEQVKGKIQRMWNELNEKIEKYGFSIIFSHDMGELFWGYNDILFDSDKWNEKNFVKACKAFAKFTKDMEEYADKLGL